MQDLHYDTEDCICALATPWVSSALSVVRTTGKGCVEAMASVFSHPEILLNSSGGRAFYGKIIDAQGHLIDEVVATVFRAPYSYTGQDCVDLSCHGSLPGLKKILELLTSNGFRPAGPGEFTLRAFLAGKMDLTKAEAVQELINAKSSSAQSLALDHLVGSIESKIKNFKDRILNLTVAFNIQLDYAEDDVETHTPDLKELDSLIESLDDLAGTYRIGRLYQEGVRVVLAGRTNAGKSSLFNYLLKSERSIVSDVPGTTRDFIEAWVQLEGLPLRLYDTAGLRETFDEVEKEGIRRSKETLENGDILLYLMDCRDAGADNQGLIQPLNAEDRQYLELYKNDPRLVKVLTKSDLLEGLKSSSDWVFISSSSGEGMKQLYEVLAKKMMIQGPLEAGVGIIDSLRQKELLEKASKSLALVRSGAQNEMPLDMLAVDLKDALDALGEITGEVTSADLLERMFSNFCVGK